MFTLIIFIAPTLMVLPIFIALGIRMRRENKATVAQWRNLRDTI